FAEGVGNLLIERPKLRHRQIRIDGGQRSPRELLHVVHGTLGFDHNSPRIDRLILLERTFPARGPLRHRNEIHAVVFPVHPCIDRVLYYTNDLEVSGRGWIVSEMLANRIAALLEELFDKSLVRHRHPDSNANATYTTLSTTTQNEAL